MPGNLFHRIYAWQENRRYRRLAIISVIVVTMLSILILVVDGNDAAKPVTKILRNSYGGGELAQNMRVFINGKEQKETIEVKVGERHYTSKQMEKIFAKALKKMEKEMLAENKSLDHVDKDLNLMTRIEGEQVDVRWELDRYDVMNSDGTIYQEVAEDFPEGTMVTLRAYLTYSEDDQIQMMEEMSAMVFPVVRSASEETIYEMKRAIEDEESKTKEKSSVSLPQKINGRDVELKNQRNQRGWYLLLLGLVIGVLFVLLEKQNEKMELEARKTQMQIDYPDIADKLALLLSAGITVKSAWNRIVQDYERQKKHSGMRYAYEEMEKACREMQSGVTEIESYENFGRRCGVKSYRKLATLLAQNLRKGTKGLTDLLRDEADRAFEERKLFARKRGEEAGTKILLPMMGMFGVVLIIIIVPSFMSMQM